MNRVADVLKWVWLSCALASGTRKPQRLISHFGTADAIYSASRKEYETLLGARSEHDVEKLCDKSLKCAENIVQICAKKNIRIITRDSVEFPERLLNISNPPCLLYASGERLCIDDELAIAIVGTRNASENGKEATKKISREIASCGGTVVTGLARGIDSLAAEGALSVGGKVVAVLGCGVDVCYPKENKELFERVKKNGTIISEYAPKTPPARENFPRRNRIISGVSLGTVIAEAPERSGALITASHALEQNRDVFVIPSCITDDSGIGSNKLLRDGAIPVMSGKDVLSEYEGMFGDRIDLERKPFAKESEEPAAVPSHRKTKAETVFSFPKGYPEKFSPDERLVLEAIGDDEVRADNISEKSGLKMQKILSLLTLLEIRGCVKQLPGGRFIIKND